MGGLTPTPVVDLNNYRSPQYRGRSRICVNIDITGVNNYPPLVYVCDTTRPILAQDGCRKKLVVVAVVVCEEEDGLKIARKEQTERVILKRQSHYVLVN